MTTFTQAEIIEMARDLGMELYGLGKNRARFVHHLEAFANLVAAKEREAVIQHLIKLKILSWDAGFIDLIRTRGKA